MKFSARHTPGEWRANGTSIQVCIRGLWRTFAKVQGGKVGQDDEAHANARLIAAAPDLLEALILQGSLDMAYAAGKARFDASGWDGKERLGDFIDRKRRAAIAKATGGDHAQAA